MAVASGQSFLEMLDWHPRDVDTLQRHYEELDPEHEAKEREREMREQWLSQSMNSSENCAPSTAGGRS